jgi:cytochrome c553
MDAVADSLFMESPRMRPFVACLFAACCVLVMHDARSRNRGQDDAPQARAYAPASCTACHGEDGNSPIASYPRLAGQKADYLYRQLQAFRDGSRVSPVMAAIAEPMSDADMRLAADFYAEQKPGDPASAPSDLIAEGRGLFMQGAPDEGVMACAACHDSAWAHAGDGRRGMGRRGGGMGLMAGMGGRGGMAGLRRDAPRLVGQHAAYIVSQLQAYADGKRPARIMDRIAARMTERQRQAVAAYLASRR